MDIKKLFENTPKEVIEKLKNAKSQEEFNKIAEEEAGLTAEQIESISGGGSCEFVSIPGCDRHCGFDFCPKWFHNG